jgi:aquaporin Z
MAERRQRDTDAGKPSLARKLGAEAIATFAITAAATSIDVFYYTGSTVDSVSRWLARGFVTSVVIYAFAETSGAHADPIVTLAFALRRVFPLRLTAAYIGAQFAGSFAAALLLLPLFRSSLGLGASHPGPGFAPWEAAVCEIVLSFVLVLVILMTASEEAIIGKQSAIAVGFTVAVCGMCAGTISGASMNPARTLAPQIVAGAFGTIWVYVVGPLIGAMLAVLVHRLLAGPPTPPERHAAEGK